MNGRDDDNDYDPTEEELRQAWDDDELAALLEEEPATVEPIDPWDMLTEAQQDAHILAGGR